MIILFDIDKTLVSTNHISLFEPVLIEHLHLSPAQIKETRDRYYETLEKPTDFSPQEYFFHLAGRALEGVEGSPKHVQEAEQLLAQYLTTEYFGSSLYPDVVRSLERLSAEYSLGIYSEGHQFFQQKKLELTGINHFFDQKYTYISRRKERPEYIDQLPSGAKVVDDKLSAVMALSARRDLEPILIRRADTPDLDVGAPEASSDHWFQTIKSFDELG